VGDLDRVFDTVEAILNVRRLPKPGVDLLAFGAADLGLGIEAHPKSPLTSFDECHAFVVEQCTDLAIKVGASTSQVSRI
jgi:hypothetical protein